MICEQMKCPHKNARKGNLRKRSNGLAREFGRMAKSSIENRSAKKDEELRHHCGNHTQSRETSSATARDFVGIPHQPRGRGSLRWSQQDFKSRLVTPDLRVMEKRRVHASIGSVSRLRSMSLRWLMSMETFCKTWFGMKPDLRKCWGNEARLALCATKNC